MHDWHAVMIEAKSRQEVLLQEADRARLLRALDNDTLDRPQLHSLVGALRSLLHQAIRAPDAS